MWILWRPNWVLQATASMSSFVVHKIMASFLTCCYCRILDEEASSLKNSVWLQARGVMSYLMSYLMLSLKMQGFAGQGLLPNSSGPDLEASKLRGFAIQARVSLAPGVVFVLQKKLFVCSGVASNFRDSDILSILWHFLYEFWSVPEVEQKSPNMKNRRARECVWTQRFMLVVSQVCTMCLAARFWNLLDVFGQSLSFVALCSEASGSWNFWTSFVSRFVWRCRSHEASIHYDTVLGRVWLLISTCD